MAFDLDLFVIGGGSGGVRAARVAAETGAKVALAEEYRLGGTCVIRGCVPKKLMVYASSYPELAAEAAAYGWGAEPGAFDWTRFHPRLRAELARLEGVYRGNLERAGVAIHDQRAVLRDPHVVELADGTALAARHVLVATGGSPATPADVPGIALAGTSNDVFLMEELPRSVLVVGGGYIACEFACVFAGLGVRTTQYYRGAQVLRGFDEEARGAVADGIRACGVDLRVETDPAELEERDGGVLVRTRDGGEAAFDRVIYATGRRPATAGLGLEEAGVRLGARGEVAVDEYSQSSVPSVYAVGDATDRVNLTPVAIREGQAFAETVFMGRRSKVDHSMVPSAVFTRPEYGSVGLSEEAAAAREPIEVYAASFRPMRSAFAERGGRAMFKLVVSKATRAVLGAHFVAEGAAELAQLAAVAMRAGASKEDFDATVAVHPTMSEEIVLMREPVRAT